MPNIGERARKSRHIEVLILSFLQFGTAKAEPLTKTALSMVDGAADYASPLDLSAEGSPRSTSSSGSSTPTPPRSMSPTPSSQSIKAKEAYLSRSSSRSSSYLGSRSQSPVAFGYPYHNSSHHTLMSETPTQTAIRG